MFCLFMVPIVFGQDPCPNWRPLDPATCPVTIDVTKIKGVYIGYVSSYTRSRAAVEAPTCDPEGMAMIATAVSVPAGLVVTADANEYLHLEWTPTLLQAGINYVTVKVTDKPPATGLDPNSITATLVWQVKARNEPPQIGGCRAL